MTATEPAWKKFLKLKSDVPVAIANIADNAISTNILKRKRDPLPEPKRSILKKPTSTEDIVEKKAKANKQKKKAKTKIKRSKKDEADSRAAQQSALHYLDQYSTHPETWKFSKPRQNYLLKHTYNDDLIPDVQFPKLVKYLQGLQGGSKNRCLEVTKRMVDRYQSQQQQQQGELESSKNELDNSHAEDEQRQEEGEAEKEEVEEVEEETEEVEPVTEEQYTRAKQVLKALTQSEEKEEAQDDET